MSKLQNLNNNYLHNYCIESYFLMLLNKLNNPLFLVYSRQYTNNKLLRSKQYLMRIKYIQPMYSLNNLHFHKKCNLEWKNGIQQDMNYMLLQNCNFSNQLDKPDKMHYLYLFYYKNLDCKLSIKRSHSKQNNQNHMDSKFLQTNNIPLNMNYIIHLLLKINIHLISNIDLLLKKHKVNLNKKSKQKMFLIFESNIMSIQY